MKKFPYLPLSNCIILTVVMLIIAFTSCKKDKETPNKVATLKTPGVLNQPLNLSNGLIGYWPLAGNGDDLSGNGHISTLTDVEPTTDRFGNPNGAMLFNGESSKIVINDASDLRLFNTDYTISVWVRVDAYSSRPNSAILSKRAGPSYDPGGYMMAVTGEALIHFTPTATPGYPNFYIGSNKPTAGGPLDLPIGVWRNYLITYDHLTQTMTEYVGRALQQYAYTSVIAPSNTNYPLVIGQDQTSINGNNGSRFQGAISDLRIYNRVITYNEMKAIWGLPVFDGPYETVYNYTVDESTSPWIDANVKIKINGTEVASELLATILRLLCLTLIIILFLSRRTPT